MKTLFTAVILSFCAAWVPQAHAEQGSERRLRYSLNEESSNMALFPLSRPPQFRRFLSGTFDAIVKERFEGGFVLEISGLRFQSIEDDRYVVEADTGLLTFNDPNVSDPRPGLPDLGLAMTILVNGEADAYDPGMTGLNRDILAATWPPVFQNLVLVGRDRRKPFWVHIYAEAQSCPADCNQDGNATLDELLMCLNIALGLATPDGCPMCDVNGDGAVSIDEVVTSVDTVLHGCSG